MTSHISPRSERSDVNSFSLARSDSLDSLHDDITSNATNFTTNFTHDVVVYGAGMAGIAAARELQAKGLSVVLLEARDRIGGRICTQPITINGTTFAAELGASWIHGTTHNPVAAMSDAAGIVRVATDMSKVAVFKAPGAQLSTWEWMVGHAAIFLFRLELFFYKLFNNRSTDDIDVQAIADRTTKRWHLQGVGGKVLQIHLAMMEKFDNTDAYTLSACRFEDAHGCAFGGQEQLFVEGYAQVPKVLASGLDVQLNTRVQHVSYTSSAVITTTSTGQEYTSRFALCTLPNGVLKAGHVAFDPPLPDCKVQALGRIGVGCYHKTFLVYDKVFWGEEHRDKQFFARLPGDGERRTWLLFINMHAIFNVPVLLCVNSGEYGRTLERMTDTDIGALATTHLKSMLGAECVPDAPAQVITSRWASDPYSCGAYSFMSVGCTARDFDRVRAPLEGRLFFAGEGTTSKYYGYTHGAYLTGVDAAQSIAAYAAKSK